MHRTPGTPIDLDTTVIESLLDPAAFDHPVTDVTLEETHISWVILAGDYAYKVKKPVTLDFLDFGTLAKRRDCCRDEVRLNRHWAPQLYLDVVPVVAAEGRYRFGGDDGVVDYAVRMRRFDASKRLDRQLEAGCLTMADMDELAGTVADGHERAAAAAPAERQRLLELTGQFMRDNFDALQGVMETSLVGRLAEWTDATLRTRADILATRFDEGRVRECHGDLHLGNIVRLDDGIRCFDCIEFSEDLRRTDVMADVAFLCMDLVARDAGGLAAHFLNRYLEIGGDYGGMAVFNLFFAYRCLVRAKVAVIRADERRRDDERQHDIDEAKFYCELAASRLGDRRPFLVIMHGVAASGKSWLAGRLADHLPAIRIRSDAERKRLAGVAATASTHSGVGAGAYRQEASAATYARLVELAGVVLDAGQNVILDAAFLERSRRIDAARLAASLGCRFAIIDVQAEESLLMERLVQRAADGAEVSEAGRAVLDYQLRTGEPLTADEAKSVVVVESGADLDCAAVARSLLEHLRAGGD